MVTAPDKMAFVRKHGQADVEIRRPDFGAQFLDAQVAIREIVRPDFNPIGQRGYR